MDKKLNLVRCGIRNIFGIAGGIPPQGEQPTFISIAQNIGYTVGLFDLKDPTIVDHGILYI